MKKIILVIILCLVTNNTTFSQDNNENDYTRNTDALIKMYNEFKYRSDKKTEFIILHSYIRGMENTLGAMSATLENEHNFKLFCPPENLVMENDNIIRILENFTEQFPTVKKYPPAIVIVQAFKVVFPCK